MGKRSRRKGIEPDDAVRALAGVGPAGAKDAAPDDAAEAGAAPAATPLEPDGRLREVSLLVEEVDYVYQLYRWIILTGKVPTAQEWLKREPWPHPDYVIDVFGSWEKFLGHALVTESPLLARLRAADAAEKDMAAARKQVEKELARVEDLRRQAQTARHAREAAEAERGEERTRADRLQRALDAAEARAAAAEAKLHERTAALADATASAAAGAAGDDPSAERAAALADELDAVRAHREELLRQVEELREQAVQDARSLNRLSTLLAELTPDDAAATGAAAGDGAAAPPPATVLEAVERAAAAAVHLRFTPDAFTSAADSPYRRPAEIAEALAVLDELAALHADPDGFGRSLTQAATERGLTYKHDVSETARSRHPHEYSTTVEGERVDLGPHVNLGSGSGAGFIARIYLHVADGSGPVPRGMYVGHVGRHLPDTTT